MCHARDKYLPKNFDAREQKKTRTLLEKWRRKEDKRGEETQKH